MELANQPFDVILRNGTLIDGTGQAAAKADVAIRADRFVKIGNLKGATALEEFDVRGLVVAPGFIDVHTHDDAALIARPEMTPKLTQGVTTVIGGNCGISAAPYRAAGDPPGLLRLILKSDQFVATTFDDYLRKVRSAAPSVNSAFLTGHITLRMEVMGEDLNRPAKPAEIVAMRELLTECLKEGSLGLSTGLYYPPARAATMQEVIEVAGPLSTYQGVYTTHMRDESDHVMESIEESLETGRLLGVPLIISHHKCMGRQNFGRSAETLARIALARLSQPVALDVYPYTAASTVLRAELVERAEKTVIAWCDPFPEFGGRDLVDAADALGCSLAEAVAKLQPAGAIYFAMDDDDVTRILQFPAAMIGSDGLPEDQHPHPRLWGTFPRVLGRYVRERKALTLVEAVHRMTGSPAEQFGIQNRGRVAVGRHADLCVFDPETVQDSATFERPISAAIGIRHVFVNGQIALKDGVPTGVRAGRALQRQDMVATVTAGAMK
ncbi:MAG TPA: D-aminoacylase [Steroidobacteraceae bacterium]|jgi:N-acyl-D-amino-acid deacylase